MKKSNKVVIKRHRKRASLITVFLCVLLVVVMMMIILTSTKNKYALEIQDDSLAIQLVMFDKSSKTPDKEITNFTWNCENRDEYKQLCMQLNYKGTTKKEYSQGEIEMIVPKFGNVGSELNENYYLEVRIAADRIEDKEKQYEWSYYYDDDNDVYIFTNNYLIPQGKNFEGSIQLAYNLEPIFKQNTNIEFQAKIRENIKGAKNVLYNSSNICKFVYTTSEASYNLEGMIENCNEGYPNLSYPFLNDYYLVKGIFSINVDNNRILALDNNQKKIGIERSACIKMDIPKECILFDSEFNNITAKTENYLSTTDGKTFCYYIAYPKSNYHDNQEVTNNIELWGRYEDEEKIQKLSENQQKMKLENMISDSIYMIENDYSDNHNSDILDDNRKNISILNLKQGRVSEYLDWWTNVSVLKIDSLADVVIGNDLLYVTRDDLSITKLQDDEYDYEKIIIPVCYFYDEGNNGNSKKAVGYSYELMVRYKDSEEYVKYSDGKLMEKEQEIIFNSKNIVGIRLVIQDLDKPICQFQIKVNTRIYSENINNGKVYHYSYLQVYEDKEIKNKKNLDYYKMNMINDEIIQYDIENYGVYLQRSVAYKNVVNNTPKFRSINHIQDIENDVTNRFYTATYKIENFFDYKDSPEIFTGFQTYNILPQGTYLISTEEDIKNNFVLKGYWTDQIKSTQSGIVFKNDEEILQYIKSHMKVNIDYNYRDSGRICISVIEDFSDDPFIFDFTKFEEYSGEYIAFDVAIPYDSIDHFGRIYKNDTFVQSDGVKACSEIKDHSNILLDNGKIDGKLIDINNNGNTDEELLYSFSTYSILHAVSTHKLYD
ncbi:MAG: hypothetical protein Q4D02_08510 [Clostridia bacterium]|nr:hypothetical protein [Clostridia bacterium]